MFKPLALSITAIITLTSIVIISVSAVKIVEDCIQAREDLARKETLDECNETARKCNTTVNRVIDVIQGSEVKIRDARQKQHEVYTRFPFGNVRVIDR